jgi:cell division protein FtsI (penicillin-binding protein 3)
MIKKIKNTNNRITGLYLIIVLISIGLVAKIIKVQQFSIAINTTSQPRYFKVEAPRGNIIADDGALLAISMPLYNVRLDMSVMDKKLFNSSLSELSTLLADLFKDKTNKEYELFLRSSK